MRWYLAAAAPLLVADAIVSLGPGGFPSLTKWARMEGLPALGVLGTFALILFVNAYGEETGWRGFALPGFRRRHTRLEACFAGWRSAHALAHFAVASWSRDHLDLVVQVCSRGRAKREAI